MTASERGHSRVTNVILAADGTDNADKEDMNFSVFIRVILTICGQLIYVTGGQGCPRSDAVTDP